MRNNTRTSREMACADTTFTPRDQLVTPRQPGGGVPVAPYAPDLQPVITRSTAPKTVRGFGTADYEVRVINTGRTGADDVELVIALDHDYLLTYDVVQTPAGFICDMELTRFVCRGALTDKTGPRPSATVNVRVWGAGLGRTAITATVDPDNRVAETNESNNTDRFDLTVTAP